MADTNPIDTAASASPEHQPATHPDQAAMQDEAIAQRLEDEPHNADAQLDAGLDESMDASDTPSALQPGDNGDPLPSSGYDEAIESQLRSKAT